MRQFVALVLNPMAALPRVQSTCKGQPWRVERSFRRIEARFKPPEEPEIRRDTCVGKEKMWVAEPNLGDNDEPL
jgi:hypothetical protein